MKPTTPALNALLFGGATLLMADLYTITLSSGQVLYWTNANTNLAWNGNIFTTSNDQGNQPMTSRGAIRNARGLEVQTCDLTLLCGSTAMLNGAQFQAFALNGGFDGATILIQRAFMAPGAWGTIVGAPTLGPGLFTVASVDTGSMTVVLHLKTIVETLAIVQMPHVLLQPSCANNIYDSGCGVIKALYTQTGVVGGAPSLNGFTLGLGQPNNYFFLGVITMTSGVCNGASKTIIGYTGDIIETALPFPAVPALGDTFSIVPGCDRQQATCLAKFNNANRFRGCPWIPAPTVAI